MSTALAPADGFLHELTARRDRIAAMLPAHIDFDRFSRAVWNAVVRNADLLDNAKVRRESLFLACCEAAEDGLMPDGRDGAIVPYKGRARWQPMVYGLTKLAMNTGLVSALYTDLVYRGEHFVFHGGMEPRIEHTHDLDAMDLGYPAVVAVYAVITLASGIKVPEVVGRKELDKFQAMGAENGPWKTWPGEMARARPARRGLKRLPLSADRAEDHRLLRTTARLDDLDAEVEVPSVAAGQPPEALPPPDKMDALEGVLTGRQPATADTPDGEPAKPTEPPPEMLRWVNEVTKRMVTAKSHDDLSATIAKQKVRERHMMIRQDQPELADRIFAAESAALQRLGPPRDDADLAQMEARLGA